MPFVRSEKLSFMLYLALAVALFTLTPEPAIAVDLMLGWTHSDVGLDGEDDGITISIAHAVPLGEDTAFDMGFEMAYVQRMGSQPAYFNWEDLEVFQDEGKVTLHIIQPGLTFGFSPDVGPWDWRLYIGGAIGLKVSESWTLPDGDWLEPDPYAYEDIDYLMMSGLSVKVGKVFVDCRYCTGLTDQLILRNDLGYPTAKAVEDLLPGVKQPENGANLANFQLGVGFSF